MSSVDIIVTKYKSNAIGLRLDNQDVRSLLN